MRRRWQLVLWGLSLLVLFFGVRAVGAGGNDDSHITFFAADRLADTGELVNYNGEHVEQSSSLTFVVVLAVLHAVFGVDLPTLAFAVGVAAAIAATGVTGVLAERLQAGAGPWASLMTASSWCLLYWSTTGMETAVAAAAAPALVLLTGSALREASPRRCLVLALFAFGFAGLRPENLLIVPGLAATVLAWSRYQRAPIPWRVATMLVASVVALAGFRLLHSGHVLPQPALAKGGFRWREGLDYLQAHASETNLALLLASFVALPVVLRHIRGRRASPLLVMATAVFMAQLAFVLLSGGDWMRNGRFIAPAIPLMAAVSAASFSRPREPGLGLVVLALVGLVQLRTMLNASEARLITLREVKAVVAEYPVLTRFPRIELAGPPHLRDAPLVIALEDWVDRLKDRTESPLLLTSGQAGMVPYYAVGRDPERVRFLDLYSLTSPRLMDCASEHLQRSSRFGRLLPLAKVLRGELDASCGKIRPDIVFSNRLKAGTQVDLRKAGYRVVFRHLGKPENIGLPRGYTNRGFIAVRDALLLPRERRQHTYRWRPGEPVLGAAAETSAEQPRQKTGG